MEHTSHDLIWDLSAIRAQFPALQRVHAGQPVIYLDGPAGSQVPQVVIDAVSDYLAHRNANVGGLFATSQESDALLDDARNAVAALLGTNDPNEVAFGSNMTTLTFALSRALGRTWSAGDEIIVTRLDHDANVTPWVLAARDAGATVHMIGFDPEDGTLNTDDLYAKLGPRTRLVAVGCASNSLGTVNPIGEICRAAHEVGAQVFLDAVHYAPHRLMDVAAWGSDFLACSAYKFFGPHVGILWGKRQILEELDAYKLRPPKDTLPDKWMTGTQSHEGIAGVRAAVDYLAELGRRTNDSNLPRRSALNTAFQCIAAHENVLCRRLLEGLSALPNIRVWGLADPARLEDRVPTVSITSQSISSRELASRLGERGIFAWHGNFYALGTTESLNLEPDGLVRLGIMHYNSREEIERLLHTLAELSR